MPGRLVRIAATLAAVITLVAPVTDAHAQERQDRRHALSINPLGIPFEWYSAEYEGRVARGFTLGISGSYFAPDDVAYSTFDVKARLYPSERALRGFSIGLSAGVSKVEEDNCDGFGADCSESSPSIGVTVDYNWLLGPSQRFFVGLGTGAKRLIGLDDDDWDDVLVAYPTLRFQVGYTF